MPKTCSSIRVMVDGYEVVIHSHGDSDRELLFLPDSGPSLPCDYLCDRLLTGVLAKVGA